MDRRVQCLVNFGFGVRRCVQISVRSVAGKTKKSGSRLGPTPVRALAGHNEDVDWPLYNRKPASAQGFASRLILSPSRNTARKRTAARDGVCRRRPFAITWLKMDHDFIFRSGSDDARHIGGSFSRSGARRDAASPAKPGFAVTIDLSSQTMTVDSSEGSYSWPISSARAGYVTPTGHFGVEGMQPMHYSKKYRQFADAAFDLLRRRLRHSRDL